MSARRGLAVIGVCVIAALTLSSCAVSTDATARALPASQDPLNLNGLVAPPAATTPPARGHVAKYTIFFIFDGALFAVPRIVRTAAPAYFTIDTALDLLAAGPQAGETRNGVTTYFSPLEHSAPYVETIANGVATIELDNSFTLLSGRALADALGQIVYTVTYVPHAKVTGVIFLIGASPFAGYSPSGQILTPPVTRADYAAIAPNSSSS